MRIKHIEIANFRKLKSVRIDFAEQTTIFVGANNSGKSSAMAALRHFLVDRTLFSINDFTLAHWTKIDEIGALWEKEIVDGELPDLAVWADVCPCLDVWLQVSMDEIHHVQHLIPTLDWSDATPIGVRLRYEPTDPDAIFQEYLRTRSNAEKILATTHSPNAGDARESHPGIENKSDQDFSVWPSCMLDFLSRRLRAVFGVRAYLLDPSKLCAPADGLARPQSLSTSSTEIASTPFKNLIRIDDIGAQRGLGFDSPGVGEQRPGRLSSQLREYFNRHLDPIAMPEPADLEALQSIHEARISFGDRVNECFADALHELQDLGYPGISDPELSLLPEIKPVDSLSHPMAVQYSVPSFGANGYRLPEASIGLGYQNLVSIVFSLMAFRDRRMKVGKASKISDNESAVPPIHLVLIEEPEAHLHAPVQRVFVRHAYQVLRKHKHLAEDTELTTHLVVSTHSSLSPMKPTFQHYGTSDGCPLHHPTQPCH